MNEIDQLENDIQSDLSAIKAKKLLLASLKKEEAKKIPFSKTKLGGAWYSTLKTITKPFATLHEKAHEQLNDPIGVQSDKYDDHAMKLFDLARKLDRSTNPTQSTMFAVTLAEFVMELEDFADRNGVNVIMHHKENLTNLRKEIERLRPPKDENQPVEQLKNLINSVCNTEETS